jgi:hypothetical protein
MAHSFLNAEETAFQRYDLVRDKNTLTLEAALAYYAQTINNADTFTTRPQIGLELTLKQHAFKTVLPYVLSVYNKTGAKNHFYYAFGDLSLSYEYLKQISHINMFFGGLGSIPLADTNEYMAREGILAGGGGRFTLGPTFSVTGIQDPAVWALGAQYIVGLPKKERFYWSWMPGAIQISAGVSTLFNETFGLSLTAYQRITLPPLNGGAARPDDLRVSTLLRPEAFIVTEKSYVRVAFDVSAYPLNSPISLTVTYGYAFDLPGKKKPSQP